MDRLELFGAFNADLMRPSRGEKRKQSARSARNICNESMYSAVSISTDRACR